MEQVIRAGRKLEAPHPARQARIGCASFRDLVIPNDVSLLNCFVLFFQHTGDITQRHGVRQGLHFPERTLTLRKGIAGVCQQVLFLSHR